MSREGVFVLDFPRAEYLAVRIVNLVPFAQVVPLQRALSSSVLYKLLYSFR